MRDAVTPNVGSSSDKLAATMRSPNRAEMRTQVMGTLSTTTAQRLSGKGVYHAVLCCMHCAAYVVVYTFFSAAIISVIHIGYILLFPVFCRVELRRGDA